jgi:hypothetical protein
MDEILNALTHPEKLYSRAEVLAKDSPVPSEPGVYAWFFNTIPQGVPTDGCVRAHGATLLYVGISPKAPPRSGGAPSKRNLRKRIRSHMRGNAYGSTLRLSLGCLLGEELEIRLRRVGNGTRLTFTEGEQVLSQWLESNALVTWAVYPAPWEAERELIKQLVLPLNLDQNLHHPFRPQLSALRSRCRAEARARPIAKS